MSEKVTYRQQYTLCGKPNCRRCAEGKGHGPYWYAYISRNGQTLRKYIGKQLPPDFQNPVLESKPPPISEEVVPPLKVFLLGQFRLERRIGPVWQEDTSPVWQHRNIRSLLAYLLISPGRRRGRDQVMDALWPNLDVENATNRLNSTVHQLRQLLEPNLTRPANSHLLRLEPDILLLAGASELWTDIDTFLRLNLNFHATSDPIQAENFLEDAVALYRGDFLQGERSSEWVLAQREVYQRIWIGLLLELADRRMSRNEFAHALESLNPILNADGTNEAAVCRLMLALTQLHRRDEALQLYQRLVTTLKTHEGIDPLPETAHIFEAVLQGDITAVMENMPFSPKQVHTAPINEQNIPQDEILQPSQVQIGRSHQSPFVGRTEELMLLRNSLYATESVGKHGNLTLTAMPTLPFGMTNNPPLLLLKGETGIGKTRLAEELSREAVKRGWSVAWSRSYEQEKDIPYRLWTEVLRKTIMMTYGSLYAQLGHTTQHKKFEALFGSNAIQHLCTLLPELQMVLPEGLAPNSLLTAQEQLHVWEAVRSFLATLSRNRPLLLVLDDIQWADDSSLELLAYLTRRLHTQAAQRILLLGTCRETELVPSHLLRSFITDLQREQAMISLNVQPLTKGQISALVAPLPEPIVEHIQTQAAGNPFFAEELARYSYSALPNSRSIEQQWEPPSLSASLLPETITAALARRMSNLSIACQRLLGKAAVLGGSFAFEMLRLMEQGPTASLDEDHLFDLLDEALQAGIVTEESSDHTIMYHFWHPLIVEHLYEQLSVARRTQLHRRAAEALQQLYQHRVEEVAAAITQHLLKGGGSTLQIASYAEIAGNRAYTLSAYPEAEHHYLLAIAQREMLSPPEAAPAHSEAQTLHLAFLHERLSECMMVQGNYEEAYQHYEHVLALRSQQTYGTQAEQQREAQISALLLYEMGRACGYLSKYELDRECNLRGEAVLHQAGVIGGVAWACLRLQYANICFDEGNFTEARLAALEALHLFEATIQAEGTPAPVTAPAHSTRTIRTIEGDQSEMGKIHEILGIIAGTVGQIAESLTQLHTALVIFEEHSNIRAMANVCNNIGTAHLVRADYAAAESYFHRCLNLAERIGDFPLVSTVCVNLGELAANMGNLLEAEEWYRRSLHLAEQVNIRSDIAYINNILALNLQEQGNLTGAYNAVRRSLTLSREIRSFPLLAAALITLAQLRITMVEEVLAKGLTPREDATITQRLHRTATTLQHALTYQGLAAEDVSRACLAQAQLALMHGDLATAQDIARQTIEKALQQEHMYSLPQAQRLLGCCLALNGSHSEADDAFEQALQLSQDHGMRLEHARTLYIFGTMLLHRSCPTSETFQVGSNYLQAAQDSFAACYAAIDLEKVRRILLNPTSRTLPYSIHVLNSGEVELL